MQVIVAEYNNRDPRVFGPFGDGERSKAKLKTRIDAMYEVARLDGTDDDIVAITVQPIETFAEVYPNWQEGVSL